VILIPSNKVPYAGFLFRSAAQANTNNRVGTWMIDAARSGAEPSGALQQFDLDRRHSLSLSAQGASLAASEHLGIVRARPAATSRTGIRRAPARRQMSNIG
jgi:hypothetical protein